jgi:hypothetical protein
MKELYGIDQKIFLNHMTEITENSTMHTTLIPTADVNKLRMEYGSTA